MTVLVTGGAGYIGSHTVLALSDRGAEVVVLDDLSSGFEWVVPETVDLVVGDVSDAALVTRLVEERGITDVIHFAAKIVVPESVADPLGYYLGNTVKTRALFENGLKAGLKRVIFSSTAAVYGEPGVETISENQVAAPINPYGRSKLMSEWMLEDAARAHGLTYTVLRYFNVAGADPAGRSGQSSRNATHLIKVASQAATGERAGIDIFGTDYPTRDGTCIRDYIHVTDLASAHVAALERLRGGGESITLNCGYGQGYSVKEVVDVVRGVSGVDFPVRESPRRPGDPACLVAAADRIRAELGWTPRLNDLPTIVRDALDWEKNLIRRRAARAGLAIEGGPRHREDGRAAPDQREPRCPERERAAAPGAVR
ncbi:UDP-glucose 4-epimerase GalE [Xanthobacter aminoxidans]|uniref:UDP-glucose 4-epimerase GalE n=1 Tax=Xanthobacter aminoxidans TaxID=186280 RepID=UPI002022C44D|nr:UDP-glucose 4-epimerase GalE [Xanthobacter aminoxidans]MCL8382363.1 UDP-glucose 4-epimerase GalE [Xanthobacter aminoxidans]